MVVPPFGVSVDWALSFAGMEKPLAWDVMRLSGLPWDAARTQAAIQCLNGGYQWLFQMDGDIIAPKETIPRLMSHRLPIVSGLYFQRFPTWTGMEAAYLPVMFNEVTDAGGKGGKQPITEYKPGSLVEAHLVPAGCLLVHRSVFERFLQNGIKRFFQWTLHADSEPPGTGYSEDFVFSRKARELGYKCYVDSTIVCTHETQGHITAKGLQPKI